MKIYFPVLSLILCSVAAPASFAQSGQASALKVGAAKVDVTPAESELPKNYEGILDHLFSRAIVIDDDVTRGALVTLDAGGMPVQIWQNVTKRAEAELKIPAKNILMTATHTHSVPGGAGASLQEKIFQSLKAATEKLQPARVGFGTGVSYINVNRNIIDPKTRRWWEGPNYEGPSDKTVAVVSFQTLSGDPIAVYYNYAMHAVTVGQLDKR
jgi:neutral ceramidase